MSKLNTIEKLRAYLDIRVHGDPEKYYYVTLWGEIVKLCSENMDEVVPFIKNDCTDEELFCLSEIFDDILEKTRSVDFLDSLQERAGLVVNPERKKDILSDIRDAAAYVKQAE